MRIILIIGLLAANASGTSLTCSLLRGGVEYSPTCAVPGVDVRVSGTGSVDTLSARTWWDFYADISTGDSTQARVQLQTNDSRTSYLTITGGTGEGRLQVSYPHGTGFSVFQSFWSGSYSVYTEINFNGDLFRDGCSGCTYSPNIGFIFGQPIPITTSYNITADLYTFGHARGALYSDARFILGEVRDSQGNIVDAEFTFTPEPSTWILSAAGHRNTKRLAHARKCRDRP